MKTRATDSPVRQRILAAAFDLFYGQGYRATGINQVIAESGVAKASFYDHFPSKDDLLHAYLEALAGKEFEEMRGEVAKYATAREKFFAPLRSLVPWFEASDYRGCPFQNILAEARADDARVREIARQHRENTRGLLEELAKGLISEEPELGRLDPDELAATYQLLLEGAIATAVAYRAMWPVERACNALEQLLRPE